MSSEISLVRFGYDPRATLGRFRFNGFSCFCLEDAWANNEPWISCIPEGSYRLERTLYHRGEYETYEIVGVPGRSRIIIHKGNDTDDVNGCIVLGLRLDSDRLRLAGGTSGPAVDEFLRVAKSIQPATINITSMRIFA